jgi:hypothetical protein
MTIISPKIGKKWQKIVITTSSPDTMYVFVDNRMADGQNGDLQNGDNKNIEQSTLTNLSTA